MASSPFQWRAGACDRQENAISITGTAQAVEASPPPAGARGSSIANSTATSISASTARASIGRSLFWALLLSVYFFAVYLSCNAITARRSDVGQAAFAWERYIPFIPAMIVPYMSIDAFFFLAPFVCSRRDQVDHARRVLLAITLAGICFLLFPLQMAQARPRIEGPFGRVFEVLYGFDRPHNLAPSLHIALRCLLLAVYAPLTRGALRVALELWFILIGFSTLLTHQHQVIDVVTGQFLGLFCLQVFPTRSAATLEPRGELSRRIGVRYALAAIAAFVAGYLLRPWGVLLWWPGAALACVAWGYLAAGPAIFRKREGRIDLATRLMLGPYLLGAWASSLIYKRRCTPFVCVAPALFIGCRLSAAQARSLLDEHGVRAVLDLTAEFAEVRLLRQLIYAQVPILDLTPPDQAQMRDCVAFISEHLPRGGVYVHCALGYSRSACIAAAYLIASGRASSADEAIAMIASARPGAVMGGEIRNVLGLNFVNA